MLDQMSTSEVNIGFIYSVLDLLARRYRLTDAVVVLRDEALGTQAFRLGQKSLNGGFAGQLGQLARASSASPTCVPNVVRDVVRNVCQLALTLHLARHSADHDPLTNIANRRHFDAALRNASVQSARYGWAFTLVLIDLDGFKAVNDKLGHAVGDDMLRSFGWALRRSVRSGDTTARMGGDEFAIILANAEGTEVLAFTERLRALLVSCPSSTSPSAPPRRPATRPIPPSSTASPTAACTRRRDHAPVTLEPSKRTSNSSSAPCPACSTWASTTARAARSIRWCSPSATRIPRRSARARRRWPACTTPMRRSMLEEATRRRRSPRGGQCGPDRPGGPSSTSMTASARCTWASPAASGSAGPGSGPAHRRRRGHAGCPARPRATSSPST